VRMYVRACVRLCGCKHLLARVHSACNIFSFSSLLYRTGHPHPAARGEVLAAF